MAEYCALARIGYTMRGPFAKAPHPIEQGVREQSRQSIVSRTDLRAGVALTGDMLTVKRPGIGIPAAEWNRILGRTLRRDIPANAVLHWSDLESPRG